MQTDIYLKFWVIHFNFTSGSRVPNGFYTHIQQGIVSSKNEIEKCTVIFL